MRDDQAFEDKIMNKDTTAKLVSNSAVSLDEGGFFSRTLRHEALKKGIAAAAAGVLFAIASEALFPSNES